MRNLHGKSFTAVQIESLSKDTRKGLSISSGFVCLYKKKYYLVTNWHVVSGRNNETNVVIHPSGAIPGYFNLKFNIATAGSKKEINYNVTRINDIPIYKRENDLHSNGLSDTPSWIEHPQFKHKVDVVCLDISAEVKNIHSMENSFVIPHNIEKELAKGTIANVMDNVFVIGFPLKSSTTPNDFPIYKGATIASEPNVYQRMPLFYIDGKTKKGMSGSAVILNERPKLENDNGVFKFYTNEVCLIGVYSGRETQTADEHEAELGIVWNVPGSLLPILENATKLLK